jgi:hypothetical protein
MSDRLLKQCMLAGVSTWSDALDSWGIIASVMVGLQQRSAGVAVTARATAGELGAFERPELTRAEAMLAADHSWNARSKLALLFPMRPQKTN